ncbi:MAG: hypothetical protein JXA46_05070, partial [Dehalococcoidales bacterium]|nr:hypothetical protein [Dehalococcoidales bacterium]
IEGEDSENYSLTQPSTSADILQRELTVSAAGIDKVFDGTTDATVTLSDDRVDEDDIIDSYASASFEDAGAGNDKSVSVSGISISGSDAFNYTLTSTTTRTTASILQATPFFSNLSHPTITAGTMSTILGGTISSHSPYPTGQVAITLAGHTQLAPIDSSNGDFSSIFITVLLTESESPYTVCYNYPGDSNYAAITSDDGQCLTVIAAGSYPVGGEVQPINSLAVLEDFLSMLNYYFGREDQKRHNMR